MPLLQLPARLVHSLEVSLDGREALLGDPPRLVHQEPLVEQIVLGIGLEIGDARLEPHEEPVVVLDRGTRVGHQRLPELLAPRPREVENCPPS